MEDILAFILTLIFIIAGIFGQTKKKPRQPRPAAEIPPQEPAAWQTFGYEEEDEEPAEVASPSYLPAEGGRSDRFHNAGNMMTRQFASKPMMKIIDTRRSSTRKRKPFPLKKALIYSEILNRKYF